MGLGGLALTSGKGTRSSPEVTGPGRRLLPGLWAAELGLSQGPGLAAPLGSFPEAWLWLFPGCRGSAWGPTRSFLVATEPADTLSCPGWCSWRWQVVEGAPREGRRPRDLTAAPQGLFPAHSQSQWRRRVLMTVTALIIKYKMRQLAQCSS